MVTIAEIKETITFPEDVTATIEKGMVTITGEKGSLSRMWAHPESSMWL